jgi:hypothetical protein
MPSRDYQPDFDIDLERGRVKEELVRRLLSTDEDRLTIEVKADAASERSGNHFVELSCKGRPSGIRVTSSDYWGVALPDGTVLLLPTSKVRHLAETAALEGNVREMTRGSHPTVGALVPLAKLVA